MTQRPDLSDAPLAPPRPPLLTVLGVIWVGLGIVAVLIGALLAFLMVVDQLALRSAPASERTAGEHLTIGGSLLLGPLPLVVSASILYAAIALLRCRRWARTYLEVVSWAWILYTVVEAVWLAWIAWTTISQRGAGDLGEALLLLAIGALFVCMTAAVSLFWLAPAAVLIFFMRWPDVRQALA